MSYFKDIDAWLDELLSVYPTDDDIRRMREDIKSKLLESYRNTEDTRRHEKTRKQRPSPAAFSY